MPWDDHSGARTPSIFFVFASGALVVHLPRDRGSATNRSCAIFTPVALCASLPLSPPHPLHPASSPDQTLTFTLLQRWRRADARVKTPRADRAPRRAQPSRQWRCAVASGVAGGGWPTKMSPTAVDERVWGKGGRGGGWERPGQPTTCCRLPVAHRGRSPPPPPRPPPPLHQRKSGLGVENSHPMQPTPPSPSCLHLHTPTTSAAAAHAQANQPDSTATPTTDGDGGKDWAPNTVAKADRLEGGDDVNTSL